MPSIKKKYFDNNYQEQSKEISSDEEIDIDDYLDDPEIGSILKSSHFYTFDDKYSNAIEEIYFKYYHLYKFYGFLEYNDLAYVDLIHIIYNNIKKIYDLGIINDIST